MSYLKLRVGGIDPKGFELNGGRQSLKGDMLEILKEDVTGDLDKQIILLKAINNISLEGVEYRE